jgi:hypothetical protein
MQGGIYMSEFELNPMFLRMSRSLGDIVIYKRDGKLFTRVKGKKTAPLTPAQQEVTRTFSRLASDWASAGKGMHSSWYTRGELKKSSGFNLYMKINFKNEREGKPVALFRSKGGIMPPLISAAPGAAGEIVCTYAIPPEEEGRHIHFYAKKKNNGISDGILKRFSPECGAAGTCTLPGLEPGGEYYIYSALTDTIIDEATQFSASVSVISAAGM